MSQQLVASWAECVHGRSADPLLWEESVYNAKTSMEARVAMVRDGFTAGTCAFKLAATKWTSSPRLCSLAARRAINRSHNAPAVPGVLERSTSSNVLSQETLMPIGRELSCVTRREQTRQLSKS